MPGQRPQDRVGARAGRRSSPTSSSTPATTSPTPTPCRRCCGRWSRCSSGPGASSWGPTTTSRPVPKNPARYLTGHARRARGTRPARLPVDLRRGAARARGWADLTNARDRRSTVGGRDVELVGVDDPHLEYDRYDAVAGPADRRRRPARSGVTARAVPAGARRDGRRRRSAGARRPHPRRPAVRCPVYGALVTNCDLDRGRAKGVSRWWPGAGRGAAAVVAPRGRRVAARLGRARAPRRTRRCGSPAGPRRRCSPWSPATPELRRLPGAVRAGWTDFGWPGRVGYPRCAGPVGSAAQPRGVAQLGSALRSGRRGRRFKSCHPDHCISAGQSHNSGRPARDGVSPQVSGDGLRLALPRALCVLAERPSGGRLNPGRLHQHCSAHPQEIMPRRSRINPTTAAPR